MKDRQPTQILDNGAIRYGIYDEAGQLLRYEYMKREDAPTVEGTPLNKANLLSDATAAKIWRGATKPDDPTVNDALSKLTEGTARVGDIELSSRTDLPASWLPCDGRYISQADYPELFNVLRVTASQGNWDTQVVDTNSAPNGQGDIISYANGVWFRTRVQISDAEYSEEPHDAKMWYSNDNMNSWHEIAIASNVQQLTPVHYYENRYVCIAIKYFPPSGYISAHYQGYIYYANQPAGPWTLGGETVGEDSGFKPGGSAWDIITDGSRYYLVGKEQGVMRSSLSLFPPAWQESSFGGQSTTNNYFNSVNNIVYNESDGYFYGAKGRTDSLSAYKLARTRTPDDYKSWQIICSNNGYYTGIAASGNIIIAMHASNNDSRVYVYSTDGGQTFTTKSLSVYPKESSQRDWVKIFNGIVVLAARTSSQAAVGVAKLLYTDDLTQGFMSVDTDANVNTFAGNDSGLIAGALESQGASSVNIYRDFTYDAKKIPTITPDSRSHAYIKAVEV
jgi:hypothetical protein